MRRIAAAPFAVCADDDVINDSDKPAVRPSLPPIGFFAIGLWAACAAVLTVCVDIPVGYLWCAAGLCVVLGLLFLCFAWKKKKVICGVLFLIGLLLGISLASVSLCVWNNNICQAEGVAAKWDCVAVSDGEQGSFGQTVLADVASEGKIFRVRIQLDSKSETMHYGDSFTVWGTIASPKDTQKASFVRSGAVGSLKAYNVESSSKTSLIGLIAQVRNQAISFFEPFSKRDSGVCAAIVCGWRGSLDEEVYRSFQVSGLAHIVAVSGAHLSLVTSFIAGLLKSLRSPRAFSCALQVLFVLAYLVFTAIPASALRAAIMTIAGLNSWALKRRPSSLNALCICIIAMIGFDATASISVSFALSTLSTLGIVLFGKLFSSWVNFLIPFCPAFVADAISLTFASSVVAAPFSAALFSQFPCVAVLANVLTAPLFAPICALGLGATTISLAFPQISLIAGNAASWAGWFLAWVVKVTASVPWASIPVDIPEGCALGFSFALCAFLWVCWPKPHKVRLASVVLAGMPIVLVLVAFGILNSSTTRIIMLDVGQGDAIVLQSCGSTLLIDTGNQDSKLREALARNGIYKLDAVLITHPDDDHMGSLSSLKGVVEVASVIVSDGVRSCSCSNCGTLKASAVQVVGEDAMQFISVGDTLHIGKWQATCIWPDEFTDEGGNADSVCLAAQADVDNDENPEGTALLVGDAETEQLAELIDSGHINQVDIYKVGHHGSKNAITSEQANILKPKLALFSVGENNRYGHPNSKTLDALESAGATILRTDISGDVVCELSPQGVSVQTLR